MRWNIMIYQPFCNTLCCFSPAGIGFWPSRVHNHQQVPVTTYRYPHVSVIHDNFLSWTGQSESMLSSSRLAGWSGIMQVTSVTLPQSHSQHVLTHVSHEGVPPVSQSSQHLLLFNMCSSMSFQDQRTHALLRGNPSPVFLSRIVYFRSTFRQPHCFSSCCHCENCAGHKL